ncbi:MAG: DUF982 domain-containing protein [Rhizobiales bacterium]|nr:DUF982 domain-containing protein [Hyphomicrobiales bacterium]
MAEDHFEAVTIETDLTNVTNTWQIAERLTDQWPAYRKGTAYRRAVVACMEHLRGCEHRGRACSVY